LRLEVTSTPSDSSLHLRLVTALPHMQMHTSKYLSKDASINLCVYTCWLAADAHAHADLDRHIDIYFEAHAET
jgi:hypothetical protein